MNKFLQWYIYRNYLEQVSFWSYFMKYVVFLTRSREISVLNAPRILCSDASWWATLLHRLNTYIHNDHILNGAVMITTHDGAFYVGYDREQILIRVRVHTARVL